MKKTGLIFCLLPLTLSLFGWGGGHTDHAQLVLQYLPREISSRWSPADQKTFRNRWAHSPDSSARIGEEILRMIGPDSVRVLNECGIQTYYKFHLESGRPPPFCFWSAPSGRRTIPPHCSFPESCCTAWRTPAPSITAP